MKPFDEIETGLPYKESDEYVENLVARCSREAVRKSQLQVSPGRHNLKPWLLGAVSVAAAAVVIAWFLWKPSIGNSPASPIDSFLSGLSEDEIQMISDWTIDEIPEFYI
ncbi:MAG: hypothetical protein ACI39U_08920 [Candidatus Cryptobacteroides sp.]